MTRDKIVDVRSFYGTVLGSHGERQVLGVIGDRGFRQRHDPRHL